MAMGDLGFGRLPARLWRSDRERIDQLRAVFAARVAAYNLGDFVSTHDALEAAVVYIEELERWVGLVPEDGDGQ